MSKMNKKIQTSNFKSPFQDADILLLFLASVCIFKFFLPLCAQVYIPVYIRCTSSGVILRNAETGSLVGLEALVRLGCWSPPLQHQDSKCTPPSQASYVGPRACEGNTLPRATSPFYRKSSDSFLLLFWRNL